MQRFFFILIVFLSTQITQAQSFIFGEVSALELKELKNNEFPQASATVLYRKQLVNIKNVSDSIISKRTEIFERIKIYNKTGFDQATKYIALLNNASIKNVKAAIYNLEEDKIVSRDFKKDTVVNDVDGEVKKTIRYKLPGLREGCIIEFQYNIEEDCCKDFYVPLQKTIPIKILDARVIAPQSLNFTTHTSGQFDEVPEIQKATRLREPNTDSPPIKENVYIIRKLNIHPFKNEPLANNEFYKAKVIFQINSKKNTKESFTDKSLQEIGKALISKPIIQEFLSDSDVYKDEISGILKGNETDLEKVNIIYNFLKIRMKWNQRISYLPEFGIKKAYNKQIGNAADINLNLLSMLRAAGFNSYPVLLNTNNDQTKNITQNKGFNYLICSIEINGSRMLLDATDEFAHPNILPLRILMQKGLLVKDNGEAEWISLISGETSNRKITLNAKLGIDNSLTGNVKMQLADYQALKFRNQYNKDNTKEIIKYLTNNNPGLNVINLKIINEAGSGNLLNLSYDFSIMNLFKNRSKQLILKKLFFFEAKKNPFSSDERQYPIDFKYPVQDEYEINIVLPQDYEVERLPNNKMIKFNKDDGEFTFLAREEGKMLQFFMTFKQNKTLILPEEYQEYRQFYQTIFNKIQEKVILRKVNYEYRKRSRNSR